jgi:dUTP pyrophosphatase
MSTPPSNGHLASHAPPSLPNSPDSKRQKPLPSFSSVAAAHPVPNIDSDPPQLQIKRLVPNAKLPTKGSAFAAGHDVYASEDKVIPARGKGLVGTGLTMAIPAGCCTFRSSFFF